MPPLVGSRQGTRRDGSVAAGAIGRWRDGAAPVKATNQEEGCPMEYSHAGALDHRYLEKLVAFTRNVAVRLSADVAEFDVRALCSASWLGYACRSDASSLGRGGRTLSVPSARCPLLAVAFQAERSSSRARQPAGGRHSGGVLDNRRSSEGYPHRRGHALVCDGGSATSRPAWAELYQARDTVQARTSSYGGRSRSLRHLRDRASYAGK